jgi:hypothetical protein
MRRPVRLAAFLLILSPAAARARVLMDQQEALRLAFRAPAAVERRTLYLDPAQVRRAAGLAGVPVESRVVTYYVASDGASAGGAILGYAYFDTHLVRTLPESIMIVVGPDGRIRRIDILSFDEPDDYFPKDRWREQFPGRRLDDDLALDRGIRTLTGATLSARAITQAARRVLALHELFVDPGASPAPAAAATPPRPSPGPPNAP